MADILDEVLNDEKDEKRLILFRKTLPTIIITTIIIAIAMTIYSWYKNRAAEHNKELGDTFIELALGESNNGSITNDSLKQLAEGKETRQAELAQIQLIHNMIDSKDFLPAMTRLEDVIANKNYLETTTSYARLLWLAIILDQEELTEAMQVKARNYLDHFSKEEQLFFANATILKSLFYKKIGQTELAAEYANSLLKVETVSRIFKDQALAILAGLKNKL